LFLALVQLRRLAGGEIVIRNILGDRAIEWTFVVEHLPSGPGRCLDFGPGGSLLATHALELGLDVIAIDLDTSDWRKQPGVKFVHADLFLADLPPGFDVIINCSTVEHVGIVGRYGVTEGRPNGDLEAMSILYDLLKPGGLMLLTVPLGRDRVFEPLCRVYGTERLPRLLAGFEVVVERYYIKNDDNQWIACSQQEATDEQASVESPKPANNLYALGCFVLEKPDD
jgi:SAM-dependent methyltransferase